jgi:hypothetical protein
MGTLPPEISREGALKDLVEIKAIFDRFNVPLFLTYGALLGVVRDGDFIEYDDDIDLCVTATIDYKTRKDIGWALYDIGFEPQQIGFRLYDRIEPAGFGYQGDEHSGIIVCQKRIRVTIFFFKEEPCETHGRDMTCVPLYKGTKLIFTPAHFFDKPGTIKFKGHTFLTPSPVKEYLEFMYGNWKKPEKGKHAPQWTQAHPGLDPQT